MITKERLEELIGQGATIYYIFEDVVFNTKEIISITLNDGASFDITTAFETKEEAEWYLEFGNITREEKLSLPSWEEFTTKNYRCCFSGKNNKIITLDCFNGETLEINENELTIFEKPLTKENYIEACRLCKKLFMGE